MFDPTNPQVLDSIYGSAGFDGVWSKLSKHLLALERYKGTKLLLDRNWVITHQDFRCCICLRNKIELAEQAEGPLVASLHCDHDHISDLIHVRARELKINQDIRPLIEKYSSYEPIIICKACNWIDSQVKRILPRVHQYFSFPPKEKSLLIKDLGKKRHKIDKKVALQKWQRRAKAFNQKIDAIECDLQDLMVNDGRFVGYNPKKKLFHAAFVRFCQIEKNASGLSFTDFLRISTGIDC